MERGCRIGMVDKLIIFILVALFIIIIASPIVFKGYYLYQLNKKSKIIQTSVGPIEFRLVGEKGPVILFIHGTPGGHDQTMEPSENFRVLTPSRPGYLRTPLSVGLTPIEQAKSFKALLIALNINEVFIVGVSGGGPASMEFAAKYPKTTLGLIALEAVSFSDNFKDADSEIIESSDRKMFFSFLLVKLLGKKALVTSMFPNSINQQKALSDIKNIKVLTNLMWSIWPLSERSNGYNNDYEQFKNLSLPLSSIKVPTIVIHGDEDINVKLDHAFFTTKSIQNSKLHIINGGDHYMFGSHAIEINKIMNNFIKDLTT
tara:strand:- start:470 stop:1417 length:948 start_codon:yes stop_codon:yes gene_type:complete